MMARQQLSSIAIDYHIHLSLNLNLSTQEHLLGIELQCRFGILLGYCPAERGIILPVSGGKTEAGLPLGFCRCLAPSYNFSSWKTSQSLSMSSIPMPWCSHHHAWKKEAVTQYFPKDKALQSVFRTCCFCSITLVPCFIQDACFGIFLFWFSLI